MPGFSFPSGAKPGFDPSHIAAGGTVFSAIAPAGNALNLLNGTFGTLVGAPTASIERTAGPLLVCSSAASQGSTFPIGGKNDANFTMAVVVVFPGVGANPEFLAQGTGSSNGQILRLAPTFEARVVGFVSLTSGFTPVVNIPYFYAVSASHDTGAWNHNHVVTNLQSGQLLSSTTAGTVGTTGTASGTNYKFGNTNGGATSTVNIAAGMIATQFNSLATLQKWAADPWSFWYP